MFNTRNNSGIFKRPYVINYVLFCLYCIKDSISKIIKCPFSLVIV